MLARSSPAAKAPRRKSWPSWRLVASRCPAIPPKWASCSKRHYARDAARRTPRASRCVAGQASEVARVDLLVPEFWLALLQIIYINILLSGDNAVVIALACRGLPPKQRRWGVIWGAAGAVVLRIVLTIFAVKLLALPWLEAAGGLLLLWIGIKLIAEEEGANPNVKVSERLWAAVRTGIISDLR